MIRTRLRYIMPMVKSTSMPAPMYLKLYVRWKMTHEKMLEAKSSAPPWKPSGMRTAASWVYTMTSEADSVTKGARLVTK